jgi:hypothetical protein
MSLFYGKHIRRRGDQLHPCTPEQIHDWTSRPRGSLHDRVSQLRQLYTIDNARYGELKADLPYFIGASFHPAARLKENFASIRYFVIDLDHFDDPDAPDLLRTREDLCQRDDLLLLFRSPSGQGLKLLFQLREACTDIGLYRAFYTSFCEALSTAHGLDRVIDTVTHDVTRVCFFSHDPQAYFNAEAEAVDFTTFVNLTDPRLPDRIEKLNREGNKAGARTQVQAEPGAGVADDDALLAIKQKLKPGFRPRPKSRPKAYVPEQLAEILPDVYAMLENQDMQLLQANSIQHGKQLRVGMGSYWAEINIFYGKRGFSVVKTAKSGSQRDLAELVYRLLQDYVNQYT